MWLALALSAHAEVPLPDYDDIVVQRTWHRINSLIEAACTGGPTVRACSKEPLDEAIQIASSFQSQVIRDARIEYLLGLAYRSRGDQAEGERHLRNATLMDADRPDAWNDLGEIYLQDGRYEQAAEAFTHVSRLVDTGSKSWLGPWRQAEVAAHRQQPEQFEEHMKVALSRGFSFQLVRGLPNWKAFYADPIMRPSVGKLITVYSTPDVLESLQSDPTKKPRPPK